MEQITRDSSIIEFNIIPAIVGYILSSIRMISRILMAGLLMILQQDH